MQLAEMQKHVYLAKKGTERRMEQGKYTNYKIMGGQSIR